MFKKPMNSQWILTILVFVQIHLEKSHFVFVTRITLFELSPLFLLYVCSDFNIFFWPLHLRPFINRKLCAARLRKTILWSKNKTYHISPLSLTLLTKHTIEPQCRCSCDFCPTSPVALLEISETSVKLS